MGWQQRARYSDRGRGRRWNPNPQYPQHDYPQYYQDQNHYRPPPMGHQYQYQLPYEQYPPYPQPQQQYSQWPPAQSRQAANICQICQNQGHYDYQCQLQEISWQEHKRPSIKASRITIKTQIKGNG